MNPHDEADTRERLARIESKLDFFLFRLDSTDAKVVALERYHSAFGMSPDQFQDWKRGVDAALQSYKDSLVVARTQSSMRKGVLALIAAAVGAIGGFLGPHLPNLFGK